MGGKQKTLVLHVLFWISYTTIFTFVEGGYQNQFRSAFLIEVAHLPLRLVVIYFNYFYLLPRFLEKAEYLKYISFTIVSILAVAFMQRYLMWSVFNPIIFPDWHNTGNFAFFRLLQAAIIITSPLIFIIGFTVVSRWANLLKRTEKLEKEKKHAELLLLKNQLNPHFFFNTLNTLYGLAQEKSDKTEQVVLKLSELMNYVLYETDQRFVPLEKEVAYIRSYIELEEIRYENRFNCNLAIAGNVQSTQVPPMLLLPFVENAFKHGINEESNNAWINIALDVTDGTLHFQLENSLPELSAGRKKNGKGIGIKNVKKRLALLYPGNHKLKCSKEEHYYRVELNINLDSNNEPS